MQSEIIPHQFLSHSVFCLFFGVFFYSPPKTPPKCFTSTGTLINCNTLETFKNCDKQAVIKTAGEQVRTIHSLSVLESVSLSVGQSVSQLLSW